MASEQTTPWEALGVAPEIGVADLRRRYAALIKEFRPESHPQEFARIRAAYEVVLPHARRREALAAERAESGQAEEALAVVEQAESGAERVHLLAPPDAVARDDAGPDARAIAPVEAMPPTPDAQSPPGRDAEPALAAHFRRFHEEASTAQGSDDEAQLPALRALLAARAQATLDDSQALEFALMRWFVESGSPPLTLLFETGRAFDWHRHVVRLSSWLSPWALREMEARLALSRDRVYARHFSGNAWLRRMHSAQAGTRLPVWRPAAVEAGFWADRWRRLSDDADAKPLAECLHPDAIRRMRGPASTDLLVGLAAASTAPSLAGVAGWTVVGAAVVFGLRRLLQAIGDLRQDHPARVVARTLVRYSVLAGILAITSAWIGGFMLSMPGPGAATFAGAALLTLPLALFATAWAWRLAAFLELTAALPFLWREAVDRLEFDGLVRSTAMPAAGRPFGTRLGTVQRLKSIRAALRLQAVEISLRERPPRARPFKLVRLTKAGGTSAWRVLWFAAWILFAIARLVHAVG